MTRRSTSISFDEDTWKLIEDKMNTSNRSQFIRDIVKDYLSEEDGPMEEINRLRREAEDLEEEAQEKRDRAQVLERGIRADDWKEELKAKREQLQEIEERIQEAKDFRFDSIGEIEDWAREDLQEKGIGPNWGEEGDYTEALRKHMEEKISRFADKQKLEQLKTERDNLQEEIDELRRKIPDEKLETEGEDENES